MWWLQPPPFYFGHKQREHSSMHRLDACRGIYTTNRKSETVRPAQVSPTMKPHSTKERPTRFKAVDLSYGAELFLGNIGNQTNNIGWFPSVLFIRYSAFLNSQVPCKLSFFGSLTQSHGFESNGSFYPPKLS